MEDVISISSQGKIGAELHGNVCKVCGKVFNGRNWKQNLEYHFLTHTKEKPYKCPICPHSSALKYNLIRHIRNRHWEVLAPSFLNSSGERDGAESRNPVLSNREVRAAMIQEVQQLTSDRLEIAQLTSPTSSHGNQNQSQHESQLTLNQNFQMTMSSNQEAQMLADNNNQIVQIASGSSNQLVPLVTGAAAAASGTSSQLSQMVAAAAAALNPLNMGLEIPISSNQEMQMPLNHGDVHLSSATSQGMSVLSKEENQTMKKT